MSTSQTLDQLLERLWEDYVTLNPHAQQVVDLLRGRDERVYNDHIAFRTYDDPKVNLETLAKPFEALGYTAGEDYDFSEKKLRARHFEPPQRDKPLIFISELRTGEFSGRLREIVQKLTAQVPADLPGRWDFPVAARPWEVSQADYEALREESEYAAWVAAFGYRANHFTVDVNALTSIETLHELNAFLKANGIAMNEVGGEIKGSPELYLEQSSTLAGEVTVHFSDGTAKIPGCYYEFAKRYKLPDGTLFTGFVAKSADRIFQSTDRR
jgi:hypothetical protein